MFESKFDKLFKQIIAQALTITPSNDFSGETFSINGDTAENPNTGYDIDLSKSDTLNKNEVLKGSKDGDYSLNKGTQVAQPVRKPFQKKVLPPTAQLSPREYLDILIKNMQKLFPDVGGNNLQNPNASVSSIPLLIKNKIDEFKRNPNKYDDALSMTLKDDKDKLIKFSYQPKNDGVYSNEWLKPVTKGQIRTFRMLQYITEFVLKTVQYFNISEFYIYQIASRIVLCLNFDRPSLQKIIQNIIIKRNKVNRNDVSSDILTKFSTDLYNVIMNDVLECAHEQIRKDWAQMFNADYR